MLSETIWNLLKSVRKIKPEINVKPWYKCKLADEMTSKNLDDKQQQVIKDRKARGLGDY